MKFLFFIVSFSFCAEIARAQSNEEVVRKIADQVIKETTLGFEATDTHKFYQRGNEIPENIKVKYASPYTGWHYTHGVLNLAMINLANQLNDPKYFDYASKHIAFGFQNYKVFEKRFKHDVKHYTYPYGEFFTMDELDDFGAISASIIEVYAKEPKPEYKAYVEKAANHLIKERPRMKDGTLVRAFPRQMTLWADDLYMSVPFLVNMTTLSGDRKYINDAVLQVKNFHKYLWDDTRQIYWHTYYTESQRNGVA
ncbi:MAG: glycosyl hydrolase, partial [Sphingobacteriales bacterium]